MKSKDFLKRIEEEREKDGMIDFGDSNCSKQDISVELQEGVCRTIDVSE